MENVILTVHLILALLLIGVVLLQRSEGGGLGMGGGGGGVMTGRQAANALSKATWILAIAFLLTSTALTLLAARKTSITSVIDQLGLSVEAPKEAPSALPGLPDYVPPPGSPVLPGAGQPVSQPAPATPATGSATPTTPTTPGAAAPVTPPAPATTPADTPDTAAPDTAAPDAAAPVTAPADGN